MKNIIAIVSSLIFTLTCAQATTVIQITKTDTGLVSTFSETDPEYIYTLLYNEKNKLIIGLNSNDYLFPFVSVSIAAPQGEVLQIGSNYTNLYLFGFYPNKPQLEWSILDGDSISMNESNNQSWFRVLELSGIKGQTFGQLALDAYDGNGGFVSARHNSDIPLSSIPEPGAPMISVISLLLLWRRSR